MGDVRISFASTSSHSHTSPWTTAITSPDTPINHLVPYALKTNTAPWTTIYGTVLLMASVVAAFRLNQDPNQWTGRRRATDWPAKFIYCIKINTDLQWQILCSWKLKIWNRLLIYETLICTPGLCNSNVIVVDKWNAEIHPKEPLRHLSMRSRWLSLHLVNWDQ